VPETACEFESRLGHQKMERLLDIGNKTTCPMAVILKDGHILMGFRHYTPNKWKKISVWTIPGGRCDEGETIENTLRREVAEEVGIEDLDIMTYIGEVPGTKEGDIVPLFICQTDQEPKLMEPHKFSEWKWVSNDNLPDNFINPGALELIKHSVFY
jgi:ADP-ribose pyrophosphatase YjhB (NUDIX family)